MNVQLRDNELWVCGCNFIEAKLIAESKKKTEINSYSRVKLKKKKLKFELILGCITMSIQRFCLLACSVE